MTEEYLEQPVTKPVSEDGRGTQVVYGVSSVQGWRTTQEDAHLVLPQFDTNTSLWGVFDGHNGADVAQFAAKRLPKIILKNCSYKKGKIESALRESFMALDQLLLTREGIKELMSLRQSYSRAPITRFNAPGFASGCTAIVTLIKGNIIYVANLGDSRCILSRNGKAFPLSEDHKPDNKPERQRIENAGGEVVFGRINYGVNVSRAFGDHSYKRKKNLSANKQMIIALPDIKVEKFEQKSDNCLVLISDGVWKSYSNEELIAYINKRIEKVRPLSKICEEVFRQILPKVFPKRGIKGTDNMTLLIVKLEFETKRKNASKKPKVEIKNTSKPGFWSSIWSTKKNTL